MPRFILAPVLTETAISFTSRLSGGQVSVVAVALLRTGAAGTQVRLLKNRTISGVGTLPRPVAGLRRSDRSQC